MPCKLVCLSCTRDKLSIIAEKVRNWYPSRAISHVLHEWQRMNHTLNLTQDQFDQYFFAGDGLCLMYCFHKWICEYSPSQLELYPSPQHLLIASMKHLHKLFTEPNQFPSDNMGYKLTEHIKTTILDDNVQNLNNFLENPEVAIQKYVQEGWDSWHISDHLIISCHLLLKTNVIFYPIGKVQWCLESFAETVPIHVVMQDKVHYSLAVLKQSLASGQQQQAQSSIQQTVQQPAALQQNPAKVEVLEEQSLSKSKRRKGKASGPQSKVLH